MGVNKFNFKASLKQDKVNNFESIFMINLRGSLVCGFLGVPASRCDQGDPDGPKVVQVPVGEVIRVLRMLRVVRVAQVSKVVQVVQLIQVVRMVMVVLVVRVVGFDDKRSDDMWFTWKC